VKRLVALLLVGAAGCASPLTSSRLQPSFAEAFTGLYVQQQQLLGRTLARADLAVLASCRRTGKDSDGPGEDWVCAVQFADGGTAVAQAFEVQLKPDGCWKATGAPAAQPSDVVDPVTGATSANPLAEFDGCFDTSWR
jgi:hypothetical protein